MHTEIFTGGITDVSEATKKYYAESTHPIMVINHFISFKILVVVFKSFAVCFTFKEFVYSTFISFVVIIRDKVINTLVL